MKVLVVDDTPENVYMLETMLKGHGYEVSTAMNGLEALEKLKLEPVKLIISDILMPKMDGFQLCHAVMSDDTLKNTPFIFYTATYTSEKDKEFALSLGASRFILKPTGHFIDIINEVLAENKTGQLKPGVITLEKETEYLKEHQVRLIKKLEDKIIELERAEARHRCQLAELQRWQDVMMGREDRVRELKREVNELCCRFGENVRYPSQEIGSGDSAAVEPKS